MIRPPDSPGAAETRDTPLSDAAETRDTPLSGPPTDRLHPMTAAQAVELPGRPLTAAGPVALAVPVPEPPAAPPEPAPATPAVDAPPPPPRAATARKAAAAGIDITAIIGTPSPEPDPEPEPAAGAAPKTASTVADRIIAHGLVAISDHLVAESIDHERRRRNRELADGATIVKQWWRSTPCTLAGLAGVGARGENAVIDLARSGCVAVTVTGNDNAAHAIAAAGVQWAVQQTGGAGGYSAVLRAPAGCDAAALVGITVALPGGGAATVHAGARSQLLVPLRGPTSDGGDTTAAVRYGGPFDAAVDVPVPAAPAWLFDPAAAGCPPGCEALRGALAPLDETTIRAVIATLTALGLPLIKLEPGAKKPVGTSWQAGPGLTEDEAVAWVLSGGNVGVNLTGTDYVLIDAENAAAAEMFAGAGILVAGVTARGQDPQDRGKFGGAHSLVRATGPLGALHRFRGQVPAGGGDGVAAGAMDWIAAQAGADGTPAAGRFVVVPPSIIDTDHGRYRYRAVPGGAYDGGPVPELAAWVTDTALAAPTPEAAAWRDELHARAAGGATRTGASGRREKAARNGDGGRAKSYLDSVVDGAEWIKWIDGEARLIPTGQTDTCGSDCEIWHWMGAENAKSVTLHDGCDGYGYGAHIWSGTMLGALACGEHLSRAQLAMALDGISFGDALRRAGIDPDDPALWGPKFTPFEVPGGAGGGGGISPVPPAGDAPMSDDDDQGGDDYSDGDDGDDDDDSSGQRLLTAIGDIEKRYDGFWDRLPFLARVRQAADANGVGRWPLLIATLPVAVSTVPPHVRLVNRVEGKGRSGTSLNLNSILLGDPEAGKSEILDLVLDLIPETHRRLIVGPGTGEGLLKKFFYVPADDEKEPQTTEPSPAPPGPDETAITNLPSSSSSIPDTTLPTDTVLMVGPEITALIAEMKRTGTKATSYLRQLWVGEAIGNTASDQNRDFQLPRHSYRFGAVLGAQTTPEAIEALFSEAGVGSTQRFLYCPAMTTKPTGSPPPFLVAPPPYWTATGTPPTTPLAYREPVFIRRPPAATAAIVAHQDKIAGTLRGFSRAAARRRVENPGVDDHRGHELVHQLKIMAALALADGSLAPTDLHWELAGAIMEVRLATLTEIVELLKIYERAGVMKKGQFRGLENSVSRRVERVENGRFTGQVRRAVLDIIARLQPVSAAGIVKELTARHQPFAEDAIDYFLGRGDVVQDGVNRRGNPLYALHK